MQQEEIKIKILVLHEISAIDIPPFLFDFIEMNLAHVTYFRACNLLKNIARIVRQLHMLSEQYFLHVNTVNWSGPNELKSHVYAKYMTNKMYNEQIKLSLQKKNAFKIEAIRKANIYFIFTQYWNFIPSA